MCACARPMMRIHTVAAGGGSILHFDGARFRVGPDSAGADPGPRCYRRGGPLTVTDANVMVGKLNASLFPGNLRARIRTSPRRRTLSAKGFDTNSPANSAIAGQPEEIADGFLRIAVENMANAIKKISIQRGYDVTEYALASFGGAGGQHACMIADTLGMETIHMHPLSGVLSAYGMGLADVRASRQHAVEQPLDEETLAHIRATGRLRPGGGEPERTGRAGRGQSDMRDRSPGALRYEGTDTALPVLIASHLATCGPRSSAPTCSNSGSPIRTASS